jgi:hypothetical protein
VWAATYLLLGLRYPPALVAQLFQGVAAKKESSTYQAIVEEGAIAEARKILGAPDRRTAARIAQLNDLAQLEELLKRLPAAKNWQELIGQPATTRPGARRRASP